MTRCKTIRSLVYEAKGFKVENRLRQWEHPSDSDICESLDIEMRGLEKRSSNRKMIQIDCLRSDKMHRLFWPTSFLYSRPSDNGPCGKEECCNAGRHTEHILRLMNVNVDTSMHTDPKTVNEKELSIVRRFEVYQVLHRFFLRIVCGLRCAW